MSSKRVERLRIQSFRGISDELILDLRETNSNKSLSLILSGDNGSGKSSIVDAIEFCLQGRIGRTHKAISHAVFHFLSEIEDYSCQTLYTVNLHVDRKHILNETEQFNQTGM